ncbi:hypothetical protein RUND412_005698 [Rhizina undulata]
MSLSSDPTKRFLEPWTGEVSVHPACTTQLESLSKMSLRDLFEASKTGDKKDGLRGHYILVRTTTDRAHWSMNDLYGSTCEVEDEQGTRCILLLKSRSLLDCDWRTYILIKEPQALALNSRSDKDGVTQVFLYVAHRSDWEMKSSTSEVIPEAWREKYWMGKTRFELKEMGNELYKARKFWGAMERYTQAMVQPAMPSIPTDMLLRNRAIAARCGNLIDMALNDSQEAVRLDPKNPKNLLQLSKSLYMARDFPSATPHLKTLLSLDPKNPEAKSLLNRCQTRQKEAKTGIYPFADMAKQFRSTMNTYFDVADYTGPVEVIITEEFGRGLYTTKEVKVGELLLVSKAMSMIYNAPGEEDRDEVVKEANNSQRGVLDIFGKLDASGEFRRSFFELFKNRREGEKLPEVESVDVYNLLAPNVVGITIRSNSFTTPLLDWETYEFENYGGGLWHLPSFINHSCWPNSWAAFMGDLMILRASEDVPAHTQIFIGYRGCSNGYLERTTELSSKFGFHCRCRRCTIESQEPPETTLATREKLVAAMMTLPKDPGWEQKLTRLISEAEKTYTLPPSQHPRVQIADEYHRLAYGFRQAGRLDKAIETYTKVLEALGFVFDKRGKVRKWGYVEITSLNTAMHLAMLCFEGRRVERGDRWRGVAATLAMVLTGWANFEGKEAECL